MTSVEDLELLRPAVERLREVLRRLDTGDIPAQLHRLARSSARQLPPPLLRKAVDVLDEDEWLRSQVVEKGDELDPESPKRADAASALFLLRPSEWESRFAELVEGSRETRLAGEVSRMQDERRKDEIKIRGLRQEVKELRQQLVEARDKPEVTDVVADDPRIESLKQLVSDAERGAVQANERATRLERELEATKKRLEQTRETLRREKRKTSPEAEPSYSGMPGTPEEVASVLDRVMLAVRRDRTTEKVIAPPDATEGPPVRPDRAEAVTRLLDRRRDWLIDGYNVSYLLEGRQPEPMDRGRLETRLKDLLTGAGAGTRIAIYWDSSEGEDSRKVGRGMEVRFVASADDAIIERAGPDTVVVSTDRRVRDESERRGATTVWSEALIEWLGM